MVADFSHFALWLAGMASVANALTTPVGDTPSGNSITKPGLNEIVPAGKAYPITWTPTTSKCASVDLVLLRGPAENIKYLSTIAEKVDNTGSFSWTPASSLEPDTTHYGIQLICTESGAYQYTTQFGVSNPSYSGSSSSASGSASGSASSDIVTSTRSVHLASSSAVSSSSPISSSSSHIPTSFYAAGNSTSAHATGTVGSHSIKTTLKPSTSTVIATDTPTVTDSPAASSSGPATVTTNGAPAATAAFGLMGAAAAAVVYLL